MLNPRDANKQSLLANQNNCFRPKYLIDLERFTVQ